LLKVAIDCGGARTIEGKGKVNQKIGKPWVPRIWNCVCDLLSCLPEDSRHGNIQPKKLDSGTPINDVGATSLNCFGWLGMQDGYVRSYHPAMLTRIQPRSNADINFWNVPSGKKRRRDDEQENLFWVL
jgi:hypothetical protein